MKKIRLTHVDFPNKKSVRTKDHSYHVWVGNETRHYFPSEKQARKYLASLSDHLTGIMFELNDIYSLVFVEYRRLWFNFDGDIANELYVIGHFQDIDKAFILLIERSTWSHGSDLVFLFIKNIIRSLLSSSQTMQTMQKDRNNWSEGRSLEIIITRLISLQEKLKTL